MKKRLLAMSMALLMAALLLPAYAEEGDVAEIAEIAGTVLPAEGRAGSR